MTYLLRYRPDSSLGERFPLTRYPWRGDPFPTVAAAEALRALCPNAAQMEVVPAVQRPDGRWTDAPEEEI